MKKSGGYNEKTYYDNLIDEMENEMKIKDGFIVRNVAGNYVVVPVGEATLDFNGMMSLNETGAFLFEKMTQEISKEELVQALREQYEVDENIATNDVDAFIAKIEGEGLFE